MTGLGGLLFRATLLARRSRALEVFRQIRSNPFATPEVAAERQLADLKLLLAHAEAHVPWYRRRFAEAGVSASSVRDLGDLASFPVLTKSELRDHAEEMVDERVDRQQLFPHHSGGSTGVPVSFYRDQAYLDDSDAGTWRNLAQAGWKPGDMVAFVWGWNERLSRMPAWEFELRQWLRRAYQFDPFQAGEVAFPRWLAAWNRVKPVVALGYASALARFADWVLATGARVHQVRGSFSTAEVLLPAQRDSIQAAFGGKVFDLYGSSEVQNIAAECAHGKMHINADFVVVETEHAGESRSPLILTSLKARAMPFIRYANEDEGRLLPDQCRCGNGFPLMALDIARTSDNFVLPNGRVVHGEYFTHLMYGQQGVASFQFRQTHPDRITLLVVPASGCQLTSEHLRPLCRSVEELSSGCARLEVEVVDSIPLSAAGKHRFTVSSLGSTDKVSSGG